MCRAFVLAALLLVACGGDDDDAGSPDGTGAPAADETTTTAFQGEAASTYEGELEDGSTLVVRLDVDPSDAAVAPFETFRSAAGAPDVTWLVGEVTVPDDVADGSGRFVTFVEPGAEPTPDGEGTVIADFACAVIDDWFALVPDDGAAVDVYAELYDGECGGQTLGVPAAPGETTTYVMVVEGDLPDFDRVFAGLAVELEPA